MLLAEALKRWFDDATSSLRITITSSGVQLERRRDGAMEQVATLRGRQKVAFVRSLRQKVGCQQHRGLLSEPSERASGYQFMQCSFGPEHLVVIKPRREASLHTLEEMGVATVDAERFRHVLRPPEGVVVIADEAGTLTCDIASVLHEGWVGTGETGAHIADFIYWHVPGLAEFRVDSSDPSFVARVGNGVRHMELVPIVMCLFNETLAVQEAFRLAQLDLRVYVLCDTRNVVDTVKWLRQTVDRTLLSEYLSGIISLRTVPGLCPHCATPDIAPDHELLRRVGLDSSAASGLMTARGCPECLRPTAERPLLAWELLGLRDDERLASLIGGDDATESELLESVAAARGLSLQDRGRAMLVSKKASLRAVEHAVFRRRVNT